MCILNSGLKSKNVRKLKDKIPLIYLFIQRDVMFLDKRLNQINIKLQPLGYSSVFTFVSMLGTILYFQGVEQFASSPSLFSFMSSQFLMPGSDEDSKEVYRLVPRSRLDYQREFATVISSPPGSLMR